MIRHCRISTSNATSQSRNLPIKQTRNYKIGINMIINKYIASDYCQRLGIALEGAISTSYGYDIVIDYSYRMRYVGDVLPVRGTPFYGYHPDHVLLVKVYLYPFMLAINKQFLSIHFIESCEHTLVRSLFDM